jgi:hypothetical protein
MAIGRPNPLSTFLALFYCHEARVPIATPRYLSMLCEIKGVSRGVKREHVDQADNHRECAGLPSDFPTLLIVNTGIKSARSVEEKDQIIEPEQVRHSAQLHVLSLCTMDLL